MKNLKDKVIIVTGGSGLLGDEFIKHLNENGAITINADISFPNNFNENQIYCDITDTNSTDNLIEKVLNKYGRIDGVVNNAYPRTDDWGTPFEDVTEESWKKNIDMQLNSYIFFSRKVIKQMILQKNGSIVNIASIYGLVGPDFTVYENTTLTNAAEYAAIKGGVINITRYLASLYGKYNIRINCISPGGIFNHQNKTFVSQYEKKVPMKRMGMPEDIAPTVSFLLSENTKYITGQNIIIDGGWTCI
jgi:NAD(P)-dependent dehydrogenase (short-subunit alcohol dehydrogenase family)